ncbi:unnamed protein product [Adineta ricciae]|uniref:TLC domain-containing protein n=1 Tax=Adineta ricciae TaxID=249248 RepID=A0A814QYP4_ADIRI|nr:unnamed protein product [Adineta ricciae]
MTVDDHVRFEYLGNTPSSDVPRFFLIFLSLVIHAIFFAMLPNTLTPLKKSYIVSTLHAVVCVISVVNFFAKYSANFTQINRIDGGGVYGTGDEIMAYSIAYSLGYFIYDLLLMLYEESVRTPTALVHHVIVLIGLTSGITNGICHTCHFYLLAEELSTIPLNLKAIYHDRARLHDFFGYLFIFTFFLSRIVYGSIICGYAFRGAPTFLRAAMNAGDYSSFVIGILQAGLCLLTRVLNVYWSMLILHKVCSSSKSKKTKAS